MKSIFIHVEGDASDRNEIDHRIYNLGGDAVLTSQLDTLLQPFSTKGFNVTLYLAFKHQPLRTQCFMLSIQERGTGWNRAAQYIGNPIRQLWLRDSHDRPAIDVSVRTFLKKGVAGFPQDDLKLMTEIQAIINKNSPPVVPVMPAL